MRKTLLQKQNFKLQSLQATLSSIFSKIFAPSSFLSRNFELSMLCFLSNSLPLKQRLKSIFKGFQDDLGQLKCQLFDQMASRDQISSKNSLKMRFKMLGSTAALLREPCSALASRSLISRQRHDTLSSRTQHDSFAFRGCRFFVLAPFCLIFIALYSYRTQLSFKKVEIPIFSTILS